MRETEKGQAGGVRVERRDRITTVILARPASRNAVDRETAEALADAMRAFDADEEADVAVLFGEGGNFCAGADLKAIASGRPNRLEREGDGPMGPTRLFLSKPVIAAIAGHAVAGGLELALFCDLRVAEEDAVLGVFCRRFGVPLIDGGTVRLPRVVGLGVALDLILTGRPVEADEASRIGLANRVVPAGTARAAAVELAESLAAFPRETMLADLDAARRAFDAPLDEALLAEHRTGTAALLGGGAARVARFQAGDGRGGRFEPPAP